VLLQLDLTVAVAVFPGIFVGELPDKTMLASLLMATGGKPGLQAPSPPGVNPS